MKNTTLLTTYIVIEDFDNGFEIQNNRIIVKDSLKPVGDFKEMAFSIIRHDGSSEDIIKKVSINAAVTLATAEMPGKEPSIIVNRAKELVESIKY